MWNGVAKRATFMQAYFIERENYYYIVKNPHNVILIQIYIYIYIYIYI